MKANAIAIIQARMSSSRLPGKVLKPLAGQPMLWHIVQRARSCRLVDNVIVATSVEPSDDALADYCAQSGIDCHRGSLDNVLSRYLEVLEKQPHDYYVRITGDCPLIHPEFIDNQINALSIYDGDMISLDVPAPLLEGQGVHSSCSLFRVAAVSANPDDFEHVGSHYFTEHHEEFRSIGLSLPAHLQDSRWRITVDEEADYKMMVKLYEDLCQGKPIPLKQAVHWLETHPEIAGINQRVQHSAINQELAAKRAARKRQVQAQAEWQGDRPE